MARNVLTYTWREILTATLLTCPAFFLWRCVFVWENLEVSKDRNVFILRARNQKIIQRQLLNSEDESNTIGRKGENNFVKDTRISQNRRLFVEVWFRFLVLRGTFTKLPKATISFVMSIHPSDRMEKLGSHCTDFHQYWYVSIFQKNCRANSNFNKIWQEQVILYTKTNIHFWSYLVNFLKWKRFLTKVVEKFEIRILCTLIFFRKSFLLWDNVEKIL